ncbi:zinc finger protein 628 isoform X2 [Sphaeramia orbicularis]|uniref:zinc finger protein 628 isoform X2 n=1 Tax=Sphaeramia orbicularis TaxID=375764 RepID=UPI0011800A00|nr:zinc finger protein 628-like isoform X2 [Sphaeramia orbicularis]
MAAADPSESPKRQKSLAEEVETSGGTDAAVEASSGLNPVDETASGKASDGPGEEQGAGDGNDGAAFASHSEASVESGAAEADKTTCNSPEDLTSAEKMARNTTASGGEQRSNDWSDTEEQDGEKATHTEGNNKSDLEAVTESGEEEQCNTHVDAKNTAEVEEINEKENSCDEGKNSTEKEKAAAPGKEVDGVEEEEEEADREEDAADMTTKPKKPRMVCKDCGKVFNQRETFNLHRHFHAHEDELTPLTCKECGLTFQHRSSLIKHRNEHIKEKEQQLLALKKEVRTTEGNFACAECQKVFYSVDKLRDHTCSNTVDKPYHCPLCRQEFQFKVSITKHMMSHSQESMFKCQECNQMFLNSMSLRYHQRCHSALKPYECPECGMVFKHYSVMEDHRRKHTDNTRSHLCNICGKTFKYSSLLHQHQYLHTGQKPFRCPECGKRFAFAQNMKAHCRQHRLRESNALSSTEQPSKQTTMSVQEPVRGPGKENTDQSEDTKCTFTCPLCPQTCPTPANLRAHMLIHEAEFEMLERTKETNQLWEKGHNCPHCPSIYRDERSLNVHLLSVHKAVAQYLENVTPDPKKPSLSNDNCQTKWKSDGLNMKSYKCSECGKAFRHRSVLELHMRIHPTDKPYQCKVCGKGFRFSSYLQQHLIIHTGKKPYKCPDCGKDFAFLQNMKTHQKLHQEKPFRCTSCRKGYSDETQLQHHMLSHNGDKPHKCDLCDKSFGLAYLLRDHMNTHTGERPHRCEECHKSFSWFSSLLVHQKIHARKRQGLSQFNSFQMATRMRGRGGRGRRGGRPVWGSSRLFGGSEMVSSQPPPFLDPALRDVEMHRRAAQPQSSMLPIHVDLQGRQQKEPWMAKLPALPVQWKVDGGEVMPVPSSQQPHVASQPTHFDNPTVSGLQHHQRGSNWADSPLISQSGPSSTHSLESSHVKDSVGSVVSSLLTAVPKKSSPLDASEMEQHRQPKLVTWSSTPTSTVVASASSLQHEFSPTYIDGAALWSIRPALLPQNSQSSSKKPGQELQIPRWQGASVSTQKEPSTPPKKEESRVWDMSNPQVTPSTVSQPEKPWNSSEPQKQWASGLAGASTSAQKDQSSAMSVSTSASHGVGSTLWDLQTPPGAPKTHNSSEKLVSNSDFQLQQKQGSSSWAGAQSQTVTQKVPISIQYEPHRFGQGIGAPVWGFQNNPVGPQTLLTGQLKPGNGAQELQQQPMAVMSERPHMPQTLPLPQLTPRTEPHKLGPRLPFPPERLLQCMICGCSLPRELDLQMHYLQHAQGEI